MMKQKRTLSPFSLAVIGLSVFFVSGCSDDDSKPGYGTATDIDGHVYQTVVIGDQEWMAENLRVTRYNNGDLLDTGLSDEAWRDTKEGAYVLFDHQHENADGINTSEEMLEAYGKLYNWYAVDDARGLCPEGWRVPSDEDWAELVEYVVGQGFPNEVNSPYGASNALKSCRQVDSPLEGCMTNVHPRWSEVWVEIEHHGFDEFGFAALPGGARWLEGNFSLLGVRGFWWSSTEACSMGSLARYMDRQKGSVHSMSLTKAGGMSIRCIRYND